MCADGQSEVAARVTRRDKWHGLIATVLLAAGWLIDTYHPVLDIRGPVNQGWVAAIPAIIAGVGALASWYSSRQSSKAQNKAANQQGELIGLQRDAANRLMPWGEDLMKRGGSAMSSLLPWYTKAAFGDRSVLSQLMAPQLREIRQNYDRPLQQLSEVSPRTGTTAAGNAAILSGRAEAQNNALLSTRFAGMQGLQSLASQLAGLGSGAVGAAFGGLQGASSGNLGMLSQLFNLRQQNAADSEGIGSALVDAYKAYGTWRASRPPAGTTTSSSASWGTGPTGAIA